MGLEPTTFAVTGRRCNQLNYTPADVEHQDSKELFHLAPEVNYLLENLFLKPISRLVGLNRSPTQ